MPARFGDRLQHMLTQFIGQGFEIGSLQPTQVRRGINGGEQAHLGHGQKINYYKFDSILRRFYMG